MNVHAENLLTVAQASHECPGRPSIRTVWRWMRRGAKGTRLESVTIGGRRYTSREALERFIRSQNSDHLTTPVSTVTSRRKQGLEAAEAELDAAGVR